MRAVLRSLDSRGWLARFFTTLGLAQDERLPAILPAALSRQLERRRYHLAAFQIERLPWREAARLVLEKVPGRPFTQHEIGLASVDSVWRELDRYCANRLNRLPDLRVVYGYEDGALETFRTAKKAGMACIYDLPVGYFEAAHRILEEEKERVPHFAATLTGLRDSMEKRQRKREEAFLADCIVACSPFVEQTLKDAGIEAAKIRCVQFGCPDMEPWSADELRREGPLRVLFVGRLGQRKGISYYLDAARRLKGREYEFLALGPMEGEAELFAPYRESVSFLAPRPHGEVLALMRRCDLFVLPTLFEGQALVALEAMKCGLPIMVTQNSGVAHLVEEGKNGFVLPLRDSGAIVEKIEMLAKDRERLHEMKLTARSKADTITWSDYERRIAELLGEFLE